MAKDFIGEQGVIITAGRTFDFTDETGAGADDGTPITKEKVMQLMAVFQHLMVAAGYTHNGLAENAVSQTPGDTQYYDALVARMVAAINEASTEAPTAFKIALRDPNSVIAAYTNPYYESEPSNYNGGGKYSLANLLHLNTLAMPIGSALPFCSATIPAGWLECNGAAISRTTYPLLFAAIGTTWGAGDGSTTFTLPDFRNRLLAGAYPSSPAGSQLTQPTTTSLINNASAGEYYGADFSGNRYVAIIKFMIRAL